MAFRATIQRIKLHFNPYVFTARARDLIETYAKTLDISLLHNDTVFMKRCENVFWLGAQSAVHARYTSSSGISKSVSRSVTSLTSAFSRVRECSVSASCYCLRHRTSVYTKQFCGAYVIYTFSILYYVIINNTARILNNI